MKPRYFPMLGTIFAFTAAGGLLLPSVAPALSTDVEANEDVQVLTRGPVHEAFAEAASYEPEAGIIVASAPPELIEELPPEQQPEGDNVTWIPGYWLWDDDQSDFLWISGIWRNIPPGRQWIPGYWDELEGGRYQWVSGYWSDGETEEVSYVAEAPPASVDTGPNIDAPSDDHTWIPGNWRYQETRYVWSPGYWTPLRQNWTWVPSRYYWSPRGYVYVDGYWDYAVVNRGVLFAPIHFRRHVYSDPGYYYTPSIVVSLNVFTDHLFIRPRCRHYYFGDYYAPRYRDAGFYASFAWHRARRGYDPIYAYQRWHHRHDRDWDRRRDDDFNFFRDNDRFRPPHTWAAMRSLRDEEFSDDRGRSRLFANSFDAYAKSPERGQRFKAVNQERRQQIVAQRQEMREFRRQRKEAEAGPAVATADGEGGKKTIREKLRRSPVAGRQAAQLAENERPPQRPEGRRGRGAAKEKAATGDGAAPADDGKLTQREKMRRAAGRGDGDASRGGRDAATDGDDTSDGKLTQREKLRRAAGKGQGGDGPSTPDADGPGRGAAKEGATDDGKLTQKEKLRRAAGKGDRAQPAPGKDTAPEVRDTPERKVTPQRKAQPERQAAPERKAQPERQTAPGRRAQPERQAAPERKAQPTPQRQAQPKREAREAPQRKQQAAPQRQVQPKPQAPQRRQQADPEKKRQPKEQASRQAPQRRQQTAAQNIGQSKPQARQATQQRRQPVAQPKPRAREAAPQRKQQAAPQRQAQRQPQRQAQRQPQQRQQAGQPQQREGRRKRENAKQ